MNTTRAVDVATVDTVVIGGGQAGLAIGYFLKASDHPVPPTSPHIRDHQRWQGDVLWDWLCERRGWETGE